MASKPAIKNATINTQTVMMEREPSTNKPPYAAEVHLSNVEEYKQQGWTIVKEITNVK